MLINLLITFRLHYCMHLADAFIHSDLFAFPWSQMHDLSIVRAVLYCLNYRK